MKIYAGWAIIAFATLISWLIANIPTGSNPELGALILWFWPPILGVICSIAFIIICALTKNKKARILTSGVIAIYLIYVGLGFYMDKSWPLVYW